MQKSIYSVSFFLYSNASTVNLQVASRHEFAVLANQKRNDTSNVVWTAEAIQGRLFFQLGELLFTPAILPASCLNNARVDGVDTDTERTELFGGGKRNTPQSKLGRAVGDKVGETAKTGDGGADNDGAGARGGLHGCGSIFDAEESWGGCMLAHGHFV